MDDVIASGRPSGVAPIGRRPSAGISARFGLPVGTVAAVALLAACSNGARLTDDDGSIYIRYVGSPAGVYDAFCDPVSEAPPGRLIQLETVKDVNIIDATYEYLPDGLELPNSTSENKFADCHDYDLKPVVTTPTTTDETVPSSDQTTSTNAPTTSAPSTTIAP